MSNVGAPYVSVGPPPRGGGTQAVKSFHAQRMEGSFAWGGSPATATLTYVGLAPVTTGALVYFTIGSLYFAGICRSDTDVAGSTGHLRTLEFNDMRYFLTNDWFFGAFNLRDVRLSEGTRLKRYKHMYPGDFAQYKWTYTDRPLTAWQILDAVLRAPTVFTKWFVDLTSRGMFPDGLLNGAIYEIDATSGMRLDSFMNLICEKTGLVFCHDPVGGQIQGVYGQGNNRQVGPSLLGQYRLVFTRKGYGVLPLPFPTNADQRRLGTALSENATNVCVLGDRNLYQVLEVPMIADWSAAWEQFIEVDLLAKDIYDHEINPFNGVRYNAYSAGNAGGNDPDHWIGAGDAKARALEVTVGEYVQMRNARSSGTGDAFADYRKFAQRMRMDMPAALYIQRILFQAVKPDATGIENIQGVVVPLDAADIVDQALARVYYDAVAGTMTTDLPPVPVDGNGLLIAKGYQVGEDLFRLVQPDRINENFFQGTNRLWGAVNFQIDDSGEGIRFVLADTPVFVSDNLLTTVDGKVVLNAGYTLAVPQMKASLVFACERYVYWKGQGLTSTRGAIDPAQPRPGRNRVENVGGLGSEFMVDAEGDYTELPFADGIYADAKANEIATDLLLCQPSYVMGGYELKWDPTLPLGTFGIPLLPGGTTMLDRLQIQTGPDGVMEVVDFTAERQKAHFEPERELERRTIQNTLYPGQAQLRQETADQKRFNQTLRSTPERTFSLFRKLLRGEVSEDLHLTKFVVGSTLPDTLPAGTPIVRNPTATVATAPASVAAGTDTVLVGVTVRQNEPTGGTLYVQPQGLTLARVQGPVAVNAAIGLAGTGGTDFSTNGAYFTAGGTPAAGVALEAISDTSIKLIHVRLGMGGSAGKVSIRGEYDPSPTTSYDEDDFVVISTGLSQGTFVAMQPIDQSLAPVPPTGGAPNWLQLPGGLLGQWS